MNAPVAIAIPFHPLADIFPLITGAEFEALRDDIAAHGVREPVILFEGAILDGRNRYRASQAAGVDCPMTEYRGDDAAAFVVSLNIHRRHLTESQRAMAAAKLANLAHGGNRRVEQAANLPLESPSLPTFEPDAPKPAPVPQAEAARLLNVSERSLRTAKKVQDTAPQEVVAAVEAGHISVSLAAQVAELPEEVQAEVAAAEPEAMKEAAREAVKKVHVSNNSGNNEWYTPPAFIEAARAVLGGFDLDPASSEVANSTVKASRIFTAEDDGLAQEWPIGTIWMNPPYAQPLMGQFADRFASEIRRGSTGIVLVNNATETAWFQTMSAVCSAICFPKARIRFLDPAGNATGTPLQGQAILYFGPDRAGFADVFRQFGLVVQHGEI
jgi:phage N-6-adenine-methyltransferase